MVTMAPKLHELGVGAEEIRGFGFRSDTKTMRIKDPETKTLITHFEGTTLSGESRAISKRFHDVLIDRINRAQNRAELDAAKAAHAREWLPGGVRDLPTGLRDCLARQGIHQ
ncbi:MAG: hypothetical protein AAGM38_18355 [Pseudomonadota bacterium]